MHYADFTEQEKSAKEIYYYYNITIILFSLKFQKSFSISVCNKYW